MMVRDGKFKNYLGGGIKKCVWVWGEPGRESGKYYSRWTGLPFERTRCRRRVEV